MADGTSALLDAYLAADKGAAARVLVTDLDAQVKKNPGERPLLQRAALRWGDYLAHKGDYRAAADAYEMAADPNAEADEQTYWANFQQANSLLMANDTKHSLALYDKVAGGDSPWSQDARLKADYIRLARRLGTPIALVGAQPVVIPPPPPASTPVQPSPPPAPQFVPARAAPEQALPGAPAPGPRS
jgi:tetratricopeptide (TPR) repeat protein